VSYFLDCLNVPIPVRSNLCQQKASVLTGSRGIKGQRMLNTRQRVNAHLEVPTNKEFATHLGGVGQIFRQFLDGEEARVLVRKCLGKRRVV
jgi:hypothetical protein